MEFTAKVDTWFLVAFYGSAAAMVVGAFVRQMSALARAMLLVIALLFVGIGYYVDHRAYIVDGAQLLERDMFGTRPFRDLDRVVSVKPSNNPIASKAASLDRLRVESDDGSVVFIAVDDEPGFLAALAKGSRLRHEGDGLVQGP